MAKITRHELEQAVKDSCDGSRVSDASAAVNAVLDTIKMALRRGDAVELRDFGKFTTRTSKARTGRNPRTGEEVAIPAKMAAKFKPSRALL